MRAIALAAAVVLSATAQTATTEDDFKVYTEAPRLLLKQQRLRLLRRERERDSPRWRQLELLVQGKAQLPESGFALALFYAASGDEQVGRGAVEAAMRPGAGVRDVAVVYDWCTAVLREPERAALESRLKQAARAPVADFASARNVAFAAIAIADGAPLRTLVQTWWQAKYAKELVAGTRTIGHADVYPMIELFHVVRDNLQIDLRDDILPVFRDLAHQRLLSYYPAVYPAAENEYRIPYFSGKGEPDLRIAALTRAAELSFVAYDNNAQEMQFLQGWLMHDRFVLRGGLGAPYEFLWANPYQPGLPFEKMPLFLHDSRTGSLLSRSTWDEDATWVGVFGRSTQLFRDGRIQVLNLKQPVMVGDIAIASGATGLDFRVAEESPRRWFVVGLKPSTAYDIEADDEDMTEAVSDSGGILSIEFSRGDNQLIRVRERRQAGK